MDDLARLEAALGPDPAPSPHSMLTMFTTPTDPTADAGEHRKQTLGGLLDMLGKCTAALDSLEAAAGAVGEVSSDEASGEAGGEAGDEAGGEAGGEASGEAGDEASGEASGGEAGGEVADGECTIA